MGQKRSKDPFGFEELIPNWQEMEDHEIIAVILAKTRRFGSEYQISNLRSYEDVQFHIKMLTQHLNVESYEAQRQLADAVEKLCSKAVVEGYATRRMTCRGRSVQITVRHRREQ